jgi:hypothetical protein
VISDMGICHPYQLSWKPKGSSGCCTICCADHRKRGSSIWNALPENGRRQSSVAAVSRTRERVLDHAFTRGAASPSGADTSASNSVSRSPHSSCYIKLHGRPLGTHQKAATLREKYGTQSRLSVRSGRDCCGRCAHWRAPEANRCDFATHCRIWMFFRPARIRFLARVGLAVTGCEQPQAVHA